MYHHPEYIEQDNCLLALHVALDFSMVPIHIVDISSEVAYIRFASVYRDFKDVDEFLQELDKLR